MQRLARGRTTQLAAASANKRVAAFAHVVRSGEHGAGAPRRQPLSVQRNGARPVRFRRESKGMQDYPSDAVVGGHRRLECWGLRTGRVGPACHPSVSGGIPGEAGDGGGPSQGRGRGLDQGSGPQPQPSRAPSSHPRAPIAEHWAGPLRAGGVPARPCRAVVMADRMRSEGCPDPSRSLGSAALER
jgi:hypothetical protein